MAQKHISVAAGALDDLDVVTAKLRDIRETGGGLPVSRAKVEAFKAIRTAREAVANLIIALANKEAGQ